MKIRTSTPLQLASNATTCKSESGNAPLLGGFESAHLMEQTEKKIRRLTARAVRDFGLIEDGDLVMACLSGGADSYTMLETLLHLKGASSIKFDVVAVNLDQKQPGFPEEVLPQYLSAREIPFRIVEQDTYSLVKEKVAPGKTTCSLCSRLRRGILYKTAEELGANKIALGHHRDDILETLLLNLFFGGRIKAMPPKLLSDNGGNVVIRPLAYCEEADIKRYAAAMKFPIIPCNLCGSQPNLKRQEMKQLLREWESKHPDRIRSMFSSISSVVPSHLMDQELFDFDSFSGIPYSKEQGDVLFDHDSSIDDFKSRIPVR